LLPLVHGNEAGAAFNKDPQFVHLDYNSKPFSTSKLSIELVGFYQQGPYAKSGLFW
jgi:hypothetical protein